MAYYSNTDSTIHSAAAGLGAVSGPLFVGGKRVSGPLTIQHFAGTGPLRAVNDGSLGKYGPLRAARDGMLGKYGPLRAVNDGSLGEYFAANGMGEYFSPNGGCAGCGKGMGEYFAANGLGAFAATGVVLDLNVPATLEEVKMWVHALAAAAGVSTAGANVDGVYREADSLLLEQALVKLFGDTGTALSITSGVPESKHLRFPSASALVTLSEKVQTQMPEGDATMFETLFPAISSFIKANYAANVDSAGRPLPIASWTYGTVIVPGAWVPGSSSGMSMTTMALLGVGALVAGFVVVRAVSR